MSQGQAGMAISAVGSILILTGYGAPLGFFMLAAGAVLTATAPVPKAKYEKTGQLMNFSSSRQPIPLLYGELETGCNKTFYHVNNPYLHIICELGEGPIEGIKRQDESIWNTTATELPRDNPPLVYLDRKLWSDYVWYGLHSNGRPDPDDPHYVYMEFFDGSSTQGVCATLAAASDGKWNAALRRTAYIYIRLEFNLDAFKQEPNVTALVRGLKVYNPVTATTAWTNNPALQAYDMMTRSSQRGGIGIAAYRIDTTALDAAIDYCTAKGWTCNLPITEQAAASDNLEQILACFRGAVINSDSGLKIKYLDLNYETHVMELTEADIVSDSLRISADFKDRPNAVKATYLDPTNNYKANDYVFTDPAAIAAEGDYREIAVDLLGLTAPGLVQKAANYTLERARLQKSVSLVAHERAMGLEPLDLVMLTHSRPGWSQRLLRVIAPSIGGNHTVGLSLVDEALTLYDDTYNLTTHDYHDTTLIDPSADPPGVINYSIAEESYDFRLRAATRLNITFEPPANYPWFSHVEVWVSTDAGTTYRHQFNAVTSFSIDPVEEGAFYYICLRVVNVFGRRQEESSSVVLSRNVVGLSATVPASLASITAIVTAGALNVFGERVNDPDIELYEFRLGASWNGAVFLASARSPVLSLAGVRPGSHTIWADTLATNGLYGATPRSASAVVNDPPDGWTVASTKGPAANLITNGDMELNSNWASVGSPTDNQRTTGQKHAGTYARLFTVDAQAEGIQSDAFATVNNGFYSWSAWVLPASSTNVHVVIRRGDNASNRVDQNFTGLTQGAWNFIQGNFQDAPGGSSAYIQFKSTAGQTSGSWYIDDVCLICGAATDSSAYLYNSDPHVRLTHAAGVLTGMWKSEIYDLGASGRYLVYVLSDLLVLGSASTWEAAIGSGTWEDTIIGKSWAEVFAPSVAPRISFRLLHGDTSPPTTEIHRLEILCCIATGRYFQLEAHIDDPNLSTYGMFESPTLKFCQ